MDKISIDAAVANPGWYRSNESRIRPPSWAEKEALLRKNAQSLPLVRQGFAFSYLNPPRRSIGDADNHEFTDYRHIARLMSLNAQVLAHNGEFGNAMDSCMDACEMGADIPRGGPLFAALVGAACQAIGRGAAWDIVDKLDSSSARINARRMETIVDESVSVADILTEEKWTSGTEMAERLNHPDWWSVFFEGGDGYSTSSNGTVGKWLALVAGNARYRTINKRRVMADFVAYLDASIAMCKKPYTARNPRPTIPGDIVNQMFCPGVCVKFMAEHMFGMNSLYVCLILQ